MIQVVCYDLDSYYYPSGENILCFSPLTFQLLLAPWHTVNFILYTKYAKSHWHLNIFQLIASKHIYFT